MAKENMKDKIIALVLSGNNRDGRVTAHFNAGKFNFRVGSNLHPIVIACTDHGISVKPV